MGWPVFLLCPGLGPVWAKAQARPGPGPGWAGPRKKYIPEAPHVCRGCGGAKPPTNHFYRQTKGLLVTAFTNYRLGP